jgi:predicted  nucleic acid-binding Zn-ribbon protein
VKASAADQRILLDLVSIDVALERVDAQRKNPPHAARVKELIASRNEHGRNLIERTNARDDIRAELQRVEGDIAISRGRKQRDEERLTQTAVARDARALESEIEALAARIDGLETRELELMENLESAEQRVSEQEDVLAGISAEGQRLSAEGKAAVEAALTEFTQLTRDRDAVAGRIPDPLLKDYERLAARGVGAGLFQHGTCGGCHMTLAPTDVDALRRASDDDVGYCPECGCILVRTHESGL